MPGDLEEFLRRAAERRAQKQQQAGANPAPARQRPARKEYSNSRRERQVREPVEEAIPIAEIVDTPISPLEHKRLQVEEAKRKAVEARKKLAEIQKSGNQSTSSQPADALTLEGNPAEQLLQLLQSPGGVQQAFLLRELLDRPDFDRW